MMTRADMALYLYSRYQRPANLVGQALDDSEEGIGAVIDRALERLKVKKADRADFAQDGDMPAVYPLLDYYVSALLIPQLSDKRDTLSVLQAHALDAVKAHGLAKAAALGIKIPAKDAPDLTAMEAPPTG